MTVLGNVVCSFCNGPLTQVICDVQKRVMFSDSQIILQYEGLHNHPQSNNQRQLNSDFLKFLENHSSSVKHGAREYHLQMVLESKPFSSIVNSWSDCIHTKMYTNHISNSNINLNKIQNIIDVYRDTDVIIMKNNVEDDNVYVFRTSKQGLRYADSIRKDSNLKDFALAPMFVDGCHKTVINMIDLSLVVYHPILQEIVCICSLIVSLKNFHGESGENRNNWILMFTLLRNLMLESGMEEINPVHILADASF